MSFIMTSGHQCSTAGILKQSQNPEWSTLEAFAASKPVWEDIVVMSHIIVKMFVALTQDLDVAWGKPLLQRDKHFENQTL
jgi:hypothetical protein